MHHLRMAYVWVSGNTREGSAHSPTLESWAPGGPASPAEVTPCLAQILTEGGLTSEVSPDSVCPSVACSSLCPWTPLPFLSQQVRPIEDGTSPKKPTLFCHSGISHSLSSVLSRLACPYVLMLLAGYRIVF